MKKLCIIACLALGLSVTTYAQQHPINEFFDDMGTANIHTEDLVTCLDADGRFRNDTIVKVFHRLDDVVWAKYVYSIIDLRYRQNYQLYFPVNITDQDYRSLFKVMVDAIADGLPVYDKIRHTTGAVVTKPIKPDFTKPMSKSDIVLSFIPDPISELMEMQKTDPEATLDSCFTNPTCTDQSVFRYDSIEDALHFEPYSYHDISKNIYKYVIQEIVFFDKHYSRLYRKILAIAPLNPRKLDSNMAKLWKSMENAEGVETEETTPEGDVLANNAEEGEDENNFMLPAPKNKSVVMDALYQSLIFWIPFDAFRPYLVNQYIIPEKNEVKRVTFDEFFQKHLYTAYILGDGNMYNKNIPDFQKREGETLTEEEIKKEQKRIQTEMLNFEQDLWEY